MAGVRAVQPEVPAHIITRSRICSASWRRLVCPRAQARALQEWPDTPVPALKIRTRARRLRAAPRTTAPARH
eukprot:4855550-Alexandrium_andersonii.AAC.1